MRFHEEAFISSDGWPGVRDALLVGQQTSHSMDAVPTLGRNYQASTGDMQLS
jgi:hypothetical protein